MSATGEWDSWVQFFATGLAASAKDTAQRIRGMLAAHREAVDRVNQAGMGAVAREIVDVLLEQPIISASELVSRTDRSTGGVYAQVKKLVDIGVLAGPFGTYNRLYVATGTWDAASS